METQDRIDWAIAATWLAGIMFCAGFWIGLAYMIWK